VILAGGAGERFWPASRVARPKPFMEVVGGASLLAATLARARRFVQRDHIWIVCGSEHAAAMRRESGLPSERVLVEPQRRNTALAVAWAAARIHAHSPQAVMAVLSADHYVPDAAAFATAMRRAAKAARRAGLLVTLGVTPTRPDTGYGYIEVGEPLGAAFPGLRRVARFVEKPDSARAEQYLAGGRHLWNAGIFAWRVDTLLGELPRTAPELAPAVEALVRAESGARRASVAPIYRDAPSLPIDVALLERSSNVCTLPVAFAWSDVGTWASLASELGVGTPGSQNLRRRPRIKRRLTKNGRSRGGVGGATGAAGAPRPAGPEAFGNRVIAGDVLCDDARNNLVWAERRLVALLGVEDLAVIDRGDVILVTKLSRSPDVRKLVTRLKQAGREDLT
jgi:mannose-1-phosphate guanylyltransferase